MHQLIKMKYNLLFLTIVSIMILFISGCDLDSLGFDTTGLNSNQQQTDKEEYKPVGKEGLKINFWENSPPTKIFEDYEFPIIMEIENAGSYEIKNAILNLIVENEYVFIPEEYRFVYLDFNKKQEYDKIGDKEFVQLNAKAKQIDPLEYYNSKIKAGICYEYEAELSETVCIDPDIRGIYEDKPCNTKEINLIDGQGAPVMINKITPYILPSGNDHFHVIFEIYIENVGNGDIITPGSVSKVCGDAGKTSFTKQDLNIVKLDDIEFSKFSLKKGSIICTPSSFDISKNKYVRCQTKEPLSNLDYKTFQTPLYIKILFGYSDSIEKSIRIEQLD
jgi:hypothetical protein